MRVTEPDLVCDGVRVTVAEIVVVTLTDAVGCAVGVPVMVPVAL